jgi:nitric oxide reductase activation protein
MDPGSWTFFAFSDKFYVLKDNTEAYTRKVRARIGGLKFGGLTYMPDAINLAGKILSQRFDEQRVLVIISDGWPYGYSNIYNELTESIDNLLKKGVIVIGVGIETDRMGVFFKLNAEVYTQQDLIKRFSNIFINASTAALEA